MQKKYIFLVEIVKIFKEGSILRLLLFLTLTVFLCQVFAARTTKVNYCASD